MLEKIKELAKQKGIPISKLEEELGLSKGYMYKLQSVTPSVTNIKKIADYFKVSIEFLLGD